MSPKNPGLQRRPDVNGNKGRLPSGSDAPIICTEWNQYRPDWDLIGRKIEKQVIIDGRNMFDPALLKRKRIHYYAIIGRTLSHLTEL